MARDPRTPDCGVKGCTRAAWKLGLCRLHRPLAQVPGYLVAVEANMAAHRVMRKWERRAITQANRAVRAGAGARGD